MKLKQALILFAVGAAVGTTGDYCHVISGTDGYPQQIFRFYFLGVPFWVPLLFGTALLAIAYSHLYFDRVIGPIFTRPGARSLGVAVYGLLVFLGLYAVSGFLPFSKLLNNFIMAAGAMLIWFSLDRTWQGVFLCLATALVGTVSEILLVKIGAFYYLPKAAELFGVPLWLPWLYVAASVAGGNFARYVTRDSILLVSRG